MYHSNKYIIFETPTPLPDYNIYIYTYTPLFTAYLWNILSAIKWELKKLQIFNE